VRAKEILEPTVKERESDALGMACMLTLLLVVRSPGVPRQTPTCVRAGP